jgi:two-component system, LuxR family, response regulator FixJ
LNESKLSELNQFVFVVDDEPMARSSVCALVRAMGMRAAAFESAEAFLHAYQQEPGCLVTDLRMHGISGLELLEKLRRDKVMIPVIIITAHARTAITVKAMQQGAITLLDKPYHEDELWDAISSALATDRRKRAEAIASQAAKQRLASLTEKERDVMTLVAAGEANKVIAKKLVVSERTVENRRRSIYEKLGVESVAEMMRILLQAEDKADSSD